MIVILILSLLLVPAAWAQGSCKPLGPCYNSDGVVNSASGQIGVLAPYTFATIYGANLSYVTRGRTASDAAPAIGGVTVSVNHIASMVFYVSPTQVNFLTPKSAGVGDARIQVIREGQAGPEVMVHLFEFAPALFQLDLLNAVGLRMPDFAVVTSDSPAHPGEYVILYATGLGDYVFPADDYIPPQSAFSMRRRTEFQLILDGAAVDDSRIEYVGSVVKYWGLFQINLKLPEWTGPNPEIRLLISGAQSPPGLRLPVQPN